MPRPALTVLTGLALAAAGLSACARDVLPRVERERPALFASYEIAETAYRIIKPGETNTSDLRRFGIDPKTTPNLKVINYVDVMRAFMPSDQVGLNDLDPAVQGCINARTDCIGYVLAPEASTQQRMGDVSLDVLGFQRETETAGWQATMLLLLVGDIVVYKLWSGTPRIEEREKETNPLGPAQDLGDKARGAIPLP